MDTHKVLDIETVTALRQLQDPGEPDIIAEIARMFFEDSATCHEAAERALLASDATALALAAHRLRGSAGLLGLQRLQHRADELEQAAHAGDPHEWARRLFRMREALDEARAALRDATLPQS